VRRREFITLVGGAAAWPLAARAQQGAMPVIGLLDPRSPEALADRLRGFRQGLKEIGFAEGENVAVEYRWAENRLDRLPTLMADLVRRRVDVIAAPGGNAAASAAKAATSTIPIIFIVSDDPVRLGLVTSLARPGANLTGVNFLAAELVTKRIEILRRLCLGPLALLFLSIRPMPQIRTQPCEMPKPLLAPSGYNSRFSTPAQPARSRPHSQRLRAIGPKPSSSETRLSSMFGESNWFN